MKRTTSFSLPYLPYFFLVLNKNIQLDDGNRNQMVSVDGFNSDLAGTIFEVTQGSILGALLFIVYINDLHYGIKYQINQFYNLRI